MSQLCFAKTKEMSISSKHLRLISWVLKCYYLVLIVSSVLSVWLP